MKVVLDTNVLAVIISRKSRFYPIWQALRAGKFEVLVTNDTMTEYEEVIGKLLSEEVANNVMDALEQLPNVHFISKYYYWNLIQNDPDDDKFVDCAVAGGADFIVTDDKHFNLLNAIPFPKIALLSSTEFLEIVLNL